MKTLLFIGALVVAISHRAQAAQPVTMKWTIDGVEREALVFAPTKKAAGGKTPLVFGFHGHGGTMHMNSLAFGFQNLWPEAIVVYPQGLPTPGERLDHGGWFPGWGYTGELKARDLKFFDTMLASLQEKYPVDERHIYTTGFSNGAFFSYLLWAERPRTFAGIAAVAGLSAAEPPLTVPLPVVQIDGEDDRIVKFTEVGATVEKVRQLDSATGQGEPLGDGRTLYRSKTGTPVLTWFHLGGHYIPPGAPELIVKFFQEHAYK